MCDAWELPSPLMALLWVGFSYTKVFCIRIDPSPLGRTMSKNLMLRISLIDPINTIMKYIAHMC